MEDQSKEQECCPEFDPGLWDHKTHEWIQKPLIRDYLPQFLHMPLPSMMGKTIGRMWKKTKKIYFYYTTCPKCAKKYGHNYIVSFAEV